MRKFFATLFLSALFALGCGGSAFAADDARSNVEVAYDGYTYACSTQAQDKENLKLKIDGVQYSCYSAAKEKRNESIPPTVVFLLFLGAVLLLWMFFEVITC